MAHLRKQELSDHVALPDEDEMVGCSPPMTALFRAVRKVAGTDAPVLLTGESGTGKELTARAIHERSVRAAGPFVAINCGSIPPNLIQSEMFGYERGAFTGATQRKLGRLEQASGGTLLLDEIGDLPLELQANLLRFLQDGKIDRVGGQAPVAIDVRIVAATNVDLERAISEGRFREDLYHRLSVLPLHTPPLRERGEDIEILARHFFDKFSKDKRRSLRGFSREALDAIRAHDWPGNVRELINRVRRAMVMCEGRQIGANDLGLENTRAAKRIVTIDEARDQAERRAIQHALGFNANNLASAARDLGVSRVTLYRLLEKHQLRGGSDKHGTA
jgi:DNA-binding NtrC family response regulator